MRLRFKSWVHLLAPCPVRRRLARRVVRQVWAGLRFRFEFVPRDAWLGVFWRRRPEVVECEHWRREVTPKPCGCCSIVRAVCDKTVVERDRLDVGVCVLPCLPLHVTWRGPRRERTPAWAALYRPPDAAPNKLEQMAGVLTPAAAAAAN